MTYPRRNTQDARTDSGRQAGHSPATARLSPGRLHFPRLLTAVRLWIVGAVNFRDLARSGVFHEIVTLDDIAIPQPDFIAGIQTVVAFGRRLAEVLLIDPELAAKGHGSRARVCVLGVVDGFQELPLALGIVRQQQ